MNRLNDEWQNLTRLLDNRTNILTASLQFHQKADEVKFRFLFRRCFFYLKKKSFFLVSCTSSNMETFMFINR